MATWRPSLFVLFGLCLILLVAGQGKNPCHQKKAAQGKGVKCEGVHLPAGLCSKCSLKNVKPNGQFQNCKSIYNINNGACKAQLQQYVKANPCDWKRKQQVQSWKKNDIEGLDYFVYSICEECCDCIIKGTKLKDYNMLKKMHKPHKPSLYTAKRGNCPSHAYFDVCKVLPNIRYISKIGGPKHKSWPKICPMLTQWFFSPASKNWLQNQNAFSKPPIKRFLNGLNHANSCAVKSVWSKCLTMESKQQRI